MSAWVVDEEHIHVLVWAGLEMIRPYGPLTWAADPDNGTLAMEPGWAGAEQIRKLLGIGETADFVGQLLWAENYRSVNYRYDEHEQVPEYQYHWPRHQSWSPVEVLKAIRCLDYQSCEHPEWASSEAKSYLDALTMACVVKLPGMDDAPWGIDITKVPAALAARA